MTKYVQRNSFIKLTFEIVLLRTSFYNGIPVGRAVIADIQFNGACPLSFMHQFSLMPFHLDQCQYSAGL